MLRFTCESDEATSLTKFPDGSAPGRTMLAKHGAASQTLERRLSGETIAERKQAWPLNKARTKFDTITTVGIPRFPGKRLAEHGAKGSVLMPKRSAGIRESAMWPPVEMNSGERGFNVTMLFSLTRFRERERESLKPPQDHCHALDKFDSLSEGLASVSEVSRSSQLVPLSRPSGNQI